MVRTKDMCLPVLLFLSVLSVLYCKSSALPEDSLPNNTSKSTHDHDSTTIASTGGIWPYIEEKSEAIYSLWTSHLQSNQTSKGSSFADGFGSSLAMTVLSELGDKTFFITAILAARFSRFAVYSGAMIALALMTLAATGLGYAAQFVPRNIIHYSSICLFVLFGLHMLYDGVTKCRAKKSEKADDDIKEGSDQSAWYKSPLVKAFILTLFAEWGDRSQIATIALSATKAASGVFVGALLAHAMCTLIATVAGRILDKFIPVAAITIAGGLLFLVFAAVALATGYTNIA